MANGAVDPAAFCQADAARAQGDAKGEIEADRDGERADRGKAGDAPPEAARLEEAEALRADRGGKLAGRERDVANVERQAEECRDRRHQAEHEAERNVRGEAG